MANLPYVQATGTLEKMLNKIKNASVPDKFSQDFVSTKLAMKGGTARAVIPFIKKMGLVNTDGNPTDRYKEIRNTAKSRKAIADSMREMYATLFEMNEYVYDLDNTKLKGLIVEATGAEPNSTPVRKTLSTFNFLKSIADFEAKNHIEVVEEAVQAEASTQNSPMPLYQQSTESNGSNGTGINLSYTINLNLPPTTDIEVFNAIFKSMKKHLIQD